MNGFEALHHAAQITCQQSSCKCPHLPTRNLQCMSCGRSMLAGVPTPDLAVRSRFPVQIQTNSRCLAASLAIQSLFFHLFTRVGFRGLSIDSCNCSCDPVVAVACRVVPGLPCCLGLKLSLPHFATHSLQERLPSHTRKRETSSRYRRLAFGRPTLWDSEVRCQGHARTLIFIRVRGVNRVFASTRSYPTPGCRPKHLTCQLRLFRLLCDVRCRYRLGNATIESSIRAIRHDTGAVLAAVRVRAAIFSGQ